MTFIALRLGSNAPTRGGELYLRGFHGHGARKPFARRTLDTSASVHKCRHALVLNVAVELNTMQIATAHLLTPRFDFGVFNFPLECCLRWD